MLKLSFKYNDNKLTLGTLTPVYLDQDQKTVTGFLPDGGEVRNRLDRNLTILTNSLHDVKINVASI